MTRQITIEVRRCHDWPFRWEAFDRDEWVAGVGITRKGAIRELLRRRKERIKWREQQAAPKPPPDLVTLQVDQ